MKKQWSLILPWFTLNLSGLIGNLKKVYTILISSTSITILTFIEKMAETLCLDLYVMNLAKKNTLIFQIGCIKKSMAMELGMTLIMVKAFHPIIVI